MIYRARITVYGEYLMHSRAWGLILSGNLFLSPFEHANSPPHPDYKNEKDSVRMELLKRGFEVQNKMYGNLPFGWGFASSSALALIHLSQQSSNTREIVDEIDHHIHGFKPSALDSSFHIRGQGGLYLSNHWNDVDFHDNIIQAHCILPKKENQLTLAQVQRQILNRGKKLCSLANEMTNMLLNGGGISYQLLFDYASELYDMHVYSETTSTIIATALDYGIIAKGVGGLYDKAILLFDINGKKSKDLDKFILHIKNIHSCKCIYSIL